MSKKFESKYGYFSENGREFIITTPKTPKPWINVISNKDHSAMYAQTGSGYSWRESAGQSRVTRFYQDLVKDDWGKFVYIRDLDDNKLWSAGYKPVMSEYEDFKVTHGIGYSIYEQKISGIRSFLKVYIAPDAPVEFMEVTLVNESDRERNLDVTTYFEWELGQHPSEHREFQKLFIDLNYNNDLNVLTAQNHFSPFPDAKGRHNNQDWFYTGFHSCSEKVKSFTGDKETFLGFCGHERAPEALVSGGVLNGFDGRFCDPAAALQVEKTLKPGASATVVFTIGTVDSRKPQETVEGFVEKYGSVEGAKAAFDGMQELLSSYIDTEDIKTPDDGMNTMVNTWLKYQSIMGRLWGRSAYYQTNAGTGYRDQLQDSQIYLVSRPEDTKAQLLLHARHQFNEGDVLHWWLAMNDVGPRTRCSDDLLWLPFILDAYLKETDDYSILNEVEPYIDGGEGDLYDHCKRAIELVMRRMSPRGIPLMGDHDWNDGLSAIGREWRGESFWMSEFFYMTLAGFVHIAKLREDNLFVKRIEDTMENLKTAFNRYAWDGKWFMQATTDDGLEVGSEKNEEGKIFLMPNIWAVMSGIADEDKAKTAMASVSEYLLRDYGTVLNYPAFTKPRKDIGYVTRYAPGLRENGGVYTHAATWSIWAYAKMGDAKNAYEAFRRICPTTRTADPDVYLAEPYVTPGNIDGPVSPYFGRGGWTWYTGSSQWLHRVATQWILGVRPEREGLLVDPCIPSDWDGFEVKRQFRNATYNISVSNPKHVSKGIKSVEVDNATLDGNVLPVFNDGKTHNVKIIMG